MYDSVVTPARAELIDGYTDVRAAALNAGATGVTISGAGPTVIAACHERNQRAIGSAMIESFADEGVEAQVYQTRIGAGATVF